MTAAAEAPETRDSLVLSFAVMGKGKRRVTKIVTLTDPRLLRAPEVKDGGGAFTNPGR